MTLHLGKREATPSPLDFRVGSFLDVERVNAKPYVPHDTGFPLQMYGNGPDPSVAPDFDGAGDCVCAMLCNAVQLWRHAAGLALAPLTGKSAIRLYSEITGYKIGDPSTDQGTDMGDAMSFMRHTGLLDEHGTRHKLAASATFDPTNLAELQAVIRTFGCAGLGIQFPAYAMTEFNAGKAWTWHSGGTIEGGHAILIPRYLTADTWAREIAVGSTFVTHLADEGFAMISTEFLDKAHRETPEGLDIAALDRALAAVK